MSATLAQQHHRSYNSANQNLRVCYFWRQRVLVYFQDFAIELARQENRSLELSVYVTCSILIYFTWDPREILLVNLLVNVTPAT